MEQVFEMLMGVNWGEVVTTVVGFFNCLYWFVNTVCIICTVFTLDLFDVYLEETIRNYLRCKIKKMFWETGDKAFGKVRQLVMDTHKVHLLSVILVSIYHYLHYYLSKIKILRLFMTRPRTTSVATATLFPIAKPHSLISSSSPAKP